VCVYTHTLLCAVADLLDGGNRLCLYRIPTFLHHQLYIYVVCEHNTHPILVVGALATLAACITTQLAISRWLNRLARHH
jgi:hypothetical protein